MTDIHCHILPGIDDGAKDVQTALEMIRTSYIQGVRRIALTSHYQSNTMNLDDYLSRRQESFTRLTAAIQQVDELQDDLMLKLGAEVLYSPELVELPVEELCLEGTDLLLLEFRNGEIPFGLDKMIFRLQSRGIIPLLAHVERYPFVMEDPRWLYRWVASGGYAQINANTILSGARYSHLPEKLIRWGLVHVLASDAHSLHRRPPNLAHGLQAVSERLGVQVAEQLEQNAATLFSGEQPELDEIYLPKKNWRNHWK